MMIEDYGGMATMSNNGNNSSRSADRTPTMPTVSYLINILSQF